MLMQPSEGFFKKDAMRNFVELSIPESLFWCFLVNFPKFLWTHSLLNSTERLLLIKAVSIVGSIAKRNCKWWYKNYSICINLSQKCDFLKRTVQTKEQVSEATVRRLQIRCSYKFCKFHKKTSILKSFFNKATDLKGWN